MPIEPTKRGEGSAQGPQESAPTGKPPKKDFRKSMEGVGRKKEQPEGKKQPPPLKPFDLKKAQAKAEQEKAQAAKLAKEEAALAAVGDQGQQKGGSITLSADVQASPHVSSVEKIIAVFQNNKIFGSEIQQVQMSSTGAETKISVQLQNGVEVNINLTGGQDLNIQIQGLTDAAQTAMDNAAHQQMLREKLAEQGFVIHQIQTVRAEGPVAAAPPPLMSPPAAPPGGQPFYGGEGEGEGGGGEGREEPEEEER